MSASFDKRKYDGLSLDEKVDEALSILETIAYAFPDGPASHRAAHEAMIKASAAQEEFWRELRLDVAKKGTWGIIIIIIGLALAGAMGKLAAIGALVSSK